MKRIFLLAIITTLTACVIDGKPKRLSINSPLCGDVSGFTVTYLAYGEGKMLMIPLSKVRAKTVLVIGLKPQEGFGTADVTVTGASANAIPWMTGVTMKHDELPKGLYPRGAFEVGCVPADPIGTHYKFNVEVVSGDIMNTLDPRVEVVK